jgi:signal transduction histidine kinase
MAILFVFTGFYSIFKKHKIALYYVFAWMILFVALFIAEQELISLDEMYILHIAFPLESLVLSFALGYKLKQNLDEKEDNDKILVQQSKLASMGEMINNIAHQWRQPLTHLSFINMNLSLAQEDNDLSKEYLTAKLNESNDQIEFMSETIDNFRDFYKPRKIRDNFLISSATQKAIDIINPSLEFHHISIVFNIENDKEIKSFENEYSQVILNLLTNAKDVLVAKRIKNPTITIDIKIENKKSVLYLYDNGSGIKEEFLDKVFEPYFSTKVKSSGIGLYMSKIIIESHFKGLISVSNTQNGACFRIEV